jgi:hypothetical protein
VCRCSVVVTQLSFGAVLLVIDSTDRQRSSISSYLNGDESFECSTI